ncbi:MAG: hypothetical protein WCI29_00745 [Actinomycetes bacterium]
MSKIRGFFVFLYDFVIGDDWRMTVAVIAGLALTALGVSRGIMLWGIVPVFVLLGLGWSLVRVVRRDRASA